MKRLSAIASLLVLLWISNSSGNDRTDTTIKVTELQARGSQSITISSRTENGLGTFLRVDYGDNGLGGCGGFCNDVRPDYRSQCKPSQRPAYNENGNCLCQYDDACE